MDGGQSSTSGSETKGRLRRFDDFLRDIVVDRSPGPLKPHAQKLPRYVATMAMAVAVAARSEREKVVAVNDLGNISVQSGDLAAARRYYEIGMKAAEKLAAADPTSAEAKRDLWVSRNKLGDVVAAIEWHEKSLPITRKLASEHPDYPLFKEDLEITERRLAALRAKAGR